MDCFNTYPDETKRKVQTSNNKRLLSTKNKVAEQKLS
ncbi:hypothetical protein RAT170B_0985 [Rickettsia argasii T170-B]|uniref:Uncharacterized protein n=1 Tax=Rickettsia argasii T170-B TaxID=1268837 RepID=A0A0F3REJ2_9RICK|nr:hypothetical protein RAT170B_0985 [Rickettsia argasii T170-B]